MVASSSSSVCCRIGRPKASVLPLPVSAAPTRSFRWCIPGLRQRACTCVGLVKPSFAIPWSSAGCKSYSAQWVIATAATSLPACLCGAAAPDASQPGGTTAGASLASAASFVSCLCFFLLAFSFAGTAGFSSSCAAALDHFGSFVRSVRVVTMRPRSVWWLSAYAMPKSASSATSSKFRHPLDSISLSKLTSISTAFHPFCFFAGCASGGGSDAPVGSLARAALRFRRFSFSPMAARGGEGRPAKITGRSCT
mmetsp:Transcript_56371/g.158913  ORF Transcript_56371/g.158913 Transcript_56371/m.158913 type:complete len:252 (+) Transcript_56371:194-949(+)